MDEFAGLCCSDVPLLENMEGVDPFPSYKPPLEALDVLSDDCISSVDCTCVYRA
jgi:hypothetical protein